MATATVKFTITNRVPLGDFGQKSVRYFGTMTFSAAGDTYATGGLLPQAGFDFKSLGPYGNRAPVAVYIESQIGSGWWYNWNFNTGKLMILSGAGTGTTAPTEVTNGTALNATTPQIFTDQVGFEIDIPTGN